MCIVLNSVERLQVEKWLNCLLGTKLTVKSSSLCRIGSLPLQGWILLCHKCDAGKYWNNIGYSKRTLCYQRGCSFSCNRSKEDNHRKYYIYPHQDVLLFCLTYHTRWKWLELSTGITHICRDTISSLASKVEHEYCMCYITAGHVTSVMCCEYHVCQVTAGQLYTALQAPCLSLQQAMWRQVMCINDQLWEERWEIAHSNRMVETRIAVFNKLGKACRRNHPLETT